MLRILYADLQTERAFQVDGDKLIETVTRYYQDESVSTFAKQFIRRDHYESF